MKAQTLLQVGAALLRAAALVVSLAVGNAVAATPEAVFDSSSETDAPLWLQGVTEQSGAIATDGTVASGLLAGQAGDFHATLSLRVLGTYSGATGILFGLRDGQNLWLAGYNPQGGRFEILRQSADGLEVLAAEEREVSAGTLLKLNLRVAGNRIGLASDGKEILTLQADEPIRGQVGIGSVQVARYDVLIEEVRIMSPGGTPLYGLPAQGPLPWTPFRARALSEGTGAWERTQVLLPPEEWREESSRAALLLDTAALGERFRQEVEVRNDTGFRGLGITGLVFGYRDATHYNLLGLDQENGRIALWYRSPAGFEPLASARFAGEEEWLRFGIEAAGDRVQVQAGGRTLFDLRDPRFAGARTGLATYGARKWPAVWRSSVLRIGGDPLPPKEPDDLLALALGARALLLEPAVLKNWEALIDHPLGPGEQGTGEALALDRAAGPLAAVFAFPHQRLARVEQLEVQLAGEGEAGPIRFSTSMDTPLTGFSELAVLQPEPGATASVAIDPVTAKYLRIELPEAAGKTGQIAEVFVRGSLQGPAVALRKAGTAVAASSDLQEREPNDTLQQASRLPPAVWVGGNTGFGDVDYFRLHLPPQGGRVVFSGRNQGTLPARYALVDQDGREIAPVETGQSATGWSATYELKGSTCFLRVSSEPVSLTVLFDDSGSMGTARDVLPKLLLGLTDRVGPGLRVKLMKYAETPVEIFDFVDDPKVLREAIEREVAASGGTETLAGLMGGLESLREVKGSRALLVALDGVDGYADPEPYQAFWRALADIGAPVHIVGIGADGWDSEDRALGLSDRAFFSEVAWASHGQFVINPTVQTFEKNVTEILTALSSAAPYQVRAEFIEGEVPAEPQGQGSLQVLLAPGMATERVRTVELILDASNSMWGQIEGKSKIEIAREVVRSTIESLPEGIHLGLRVYGHRWPRADKRACLDSELLFPIGPTNRATLLRSIEGITPKGRTPLVYSLLQTPMDFHGLPRGTVILVSDGIESCDGQIEDVVKRLQASGIELTVHVVGFDVRERSSREELERLARSLGGRYFAAGNARELSGSLERTLHIEYEVLAADGAVVARGRAGGEALTLAAGAYRLRVLLEPEPMEASIRVDPGQQQVLTVSGSRGAWKVGGR